MVWGTFHFLFKKMRLAAEGVCLEVWLLLRGMVTFAVGWLLSTTVNVAVPPASVVVNPEVGEMVTPAVSLSVLLTDTSAAFRSEERRVGQEGRSRWSPDH